MLFGCGDRVPTGVLHDRVGVILKIGDMIIQSCLPKYMEVEINGKSKKGQPRKVWEECIKELEQYGLRKEDVYNQKKWQEQIRSKLANSSQPG